MSGVKAMQLSNGLTPVGLHLGHLLAEMPLILVGSTVVIVVWKAIASAQYADLGIMVSSDMHAFRWKRRRSSYDYTNYPVDHLRPIRGSREPFLICSGPLPYVNTERAFS